MQIAPINSLIIEITRLCNFKCKMCLLHSKDRDKGQAKSHPKFMDVNLFKNIVDQYAELDQQYKTILPQYQGEPLLHPNFLELCNYINDKNINFAFTTNGSLLTPEITDKLIKLKHFTSICFSLDSMNKETFENIRINSNFDIVLKNINYFLSKRSESNLSSISINFVIMDENELELNSFVKYWLDDLNVDSISASYVTDDNCIPVKTNYSVTRHPCNHVNYSMTILTNGQVIPCCRDYEYIFNMGNVNEQSLIDIWNGREYKKLRKLQLNKKWNQHELCKNCLTWTGLPPNGITHLKENTIYSIENSNSKMGPFWFNWRR